MMIPYNSDILLQDSSNQPIKLYHGTATDFEFFRPLSHFGSKSAATLAAQMAIENGCEILDSTSVSQRQLENYSIKAYILPEKRKIIPVHLIMKRPLYVHDLGMHTIENYKKIVLQELEKDTYTNLMIKEHPVLQKFAIAGMLMNAYQEQQTVPPIYDMIFKDPMDMEKMSSFDVANELYCEKLYPVMAQMDEEDVSNADKVNRQHLVLQRMIRFFESRGYDGFVYHNRGEDKGHLSYIAFRSEQVVRLDRDLPKYVNLYPDEEDSQQLRQMEREALNRCCERPLSDRELKRKHDFREDVLKDIPRQEIEKDEKLKKVVSNYYPIWRDSEEFFH